MLLIIGWLPILRCLLLMFELVLLLRVKKLVVRMLLLNNSRRLLLGWGLLLSVQKLVMSI